MPFSSLYNKNKYIVMLLAYCVNNQMVIADVRKKYKMGVSEIRAREDLRVGPQTTKMKKKIEETFYSGCKMIIAFWVRMTKITKPTVQSLSYMWPYGAMVARLTPDQNVGCSSPSGVTF